MQKLGKTLIPETELATPNGARFDPSELRARKTPLEKINDPIEARRTPSELAADVLARPQRAEKYAELVKSNETWKWTDINDKKLPYTEQTAIKQLAVEKGLIPKIYVDPKTGFADFSKFTIREIQLPKSLWNKTDAVQFRWLDNQIGGRPKGYTWHHNEAAGKMQLVEFGVHNITNHNGGRTTWAGGTR